MTQAPQRRAVAPTIPGPERSALSSLRFIRGALQSSTSDGVPFRLLELARTYGPLVQLPVPGRRAMYLITEPDTVQEVLTRTGRAFGKGFARRGAAPGAEGVSPLTPVLGQGLLTSDGELHKRQRRLMQPLFHRERIAGYTEAFAALAEQHCVAWPDGQRLDLHEEMTELTLAIIARTVFDVDLDDDVIKAVRQALGEGDRMGPFAPIIAPLVRRLSFVPSIRAAGAAIERFDEVVAGLIEHRRSTGTAGRADLLSLLLEARDSETGEPMDARQVRDEVLTILLAGHETTANALSWTFHLLATHPQAQQRLQQELDSVLTDGRTATMADLARLPFTVAVFNEAMRLYPPAWVMLRRLRQDYEIEGHQLPAGAMLLLSPFVTHRDERWWPRPDEFRPERWLDQAATAARPRFSFVPFGAGPRQCIGFAFAELEGQLVLASIARRWQVQAPAGHQQQIRARVTLQPRGGCS